MTEEIEETLNEAEDFEVLADMDEQKILHDAIPEHLPILPLKNTVLFPGAIIPITVGRERSMRLVREVFRSKDKILGVITQKNDQAENPSISDLWEVGTVAHIHKMVKMPDGSLTIVIQGRGKFRALAEVAQEPWLVAQVAREHDEYPGSRKTKALVNALRTESIRIIDLSPHIPNETKVPLSNIGDLSLLIYLIASNLNINNSRKQQILESNNLEEKAELVLRYLSSELNVLELSDEIQKKVKNDLDKQQREYYLRQQIRTIQDELGEGGPESELDGLRKRAEQKQWSKEAGEIFEKELTKLQRLQPSMPDYGVVMNYLDWMLELPWQDYRADHINLKVVKEKLDLDHYGLEKVKARILEHLAVLSLKKDKRAPILCLYGPPGVGKTSLGKSIADALGRSYVRISLGGVHDESEIRGHRRTYIGAMPGKIIQGYKRAKSGNPVFVLDEIDKLGSDFRGDPSSALLEVLDPEQNATFRDHFLDLDYDLSKTMFIATANSLDTIPAALRDRLEIIEINGYSEEEKLEIARRHLVPNQLAEHGLNRSQISFHQSALRQVINRYTRESGVRWLTQHIASVCRHAAVKIASGDVRKYTFNDKQVEPVLGLPPFSNEAYALPDRPGVAVGLAWTPVGGDILFIETTLFHGTGRLSVTGQLGDVMKESATLAYHYIRAHATELCIPDEVFSHWDIHLHFPAGAIRKDGPSAGITILTALTSLFTQRMVREHLAMTGEITLRGKVLPVGGIREKVLAARRAGIQTVILCEQNKKDIAEIPAQHLEGLTFYYVQSMDEVLKLALRAEKVKKPQNLLPPAGSGEKKRPGAKGESAYA